jgi:hypothetical protein
MARFIESVRPSDQPAMSASSVLVGMAGWSRISLIIYLKIPSDPHSMQM